MNAVTPRIFVAATQQNDGKTTTALGLFSALQNKFRRIGYFKPVGQRYVEVDGAKVDEDTVLIDKTFSVHTPLEAMSPIAIEPDFTRRYIANANREFFVNRLRNSFDRAAWEKDFLIIEGSGHAGVGAVFDLSNARVAHLLKSKVILVTRGGIGRAIDEIVLNKALFDSEGVELAGVILNKVLPEKIEEVRDFVSRGLKRLGIDLLGVLPLESVLADATLGQVCREIKGAFLCGKNFARRHFKNVVIGAMNSAHVVAHFKPGTLLVTPGDREDIILAALSTCVAADVAARPLSGLVLSGDMRPSESIINLISTAHLPVIASPLDSYAVASRIHSMTVKTLPGDCEKISRIQSLINTHLDVERLIGKIAE
jgi:BioD-like phosphotransacetylase family protein